MIPLVFFRLASILYEIFYTVFFFFLGVVFVVVCWLYYILLGWTKLNFMKYNDRYIAYLTLLSKETKMIKKPSKTRL
jgi:hypothetical protein